MADFHFMGILRTMKGIEDRLVFSKRTVTS